MNLSGAKAVIKSLEYEHVDTIFGIPGGVIIPIYDELYQQDAITHYLVRHEQAAAHAADGYARATGKVGVCMATSGPGATNLVTGIATAYMDSVPLVAVTGQVTTDLIGYDAFQEADITGITQPITKHNYLIRDASEIPQTIKEAFHIASTGRPGPVLVDVPKDVQTTTVPFDYPKKVHLPGYQPTYDGHPGQIKRAAKAISEAHRPVIYVGGGAKISGASEEVRALAEAILAPVTMTLMGMGVLPAEHPLSLGMLGMHGTRYANYAVTESDLIIAIGARFDDRVTGKIASFAPNAKIIHIDIDPAEIGKNVRVDIPIVGDVKRVLQKLMPMLTQTRTKEWMEKVHTWKREYPLEFEETGLKPQYVVREISRLCPDAIVCTEVGQHQMWAAQYFSHRHPRNFISSGGLGTMGYGFPASIGAKIGRPDETVFDLAGDGSFTMNCQELATAVAYDVQVKVAIFNNGYLGMVRQWQELFYDRRYSATKLSEINFVKLADAFGAHGIRVDSPSEVAPAIKEALSVPKPVIIDFRVEPEECVFPMVPAGAALNEILDAKSGKV
ncbi:MAG: biosynthetic-type acetolactate synthase large subunit [Halobacteriota archaeon]|jgi:acetolactate synthase I/II/III large subunit